MQPLDFKFIVPLQKATNDRIEGIASGTGIDRDEERMSENALDMMVHDINTVGVNLFGNHEHNWENTLGVIKAGRRTGQEMFIGCDLDDPRTNPKIPMLINKLNRGIKLGFSVGGNVTGIKWEYDSKVGKKVKVLDKVKIYEVSVVGIPSYPGANMAISKQIAKSFREQGIAWEDAGESCPCCYSQLRKGVCKTCFWRN